MKAFWIFGVSRRVTVKFSEGSSEGIEDLELALRDPDQISFGQIVSKHLVRL